MPSSRSSVLVAALACLVGFATTGCGYRQIVGLDPTAEYPSGRTLAKSEANDLNALVVQATQEPDSLPLLVEKYFGDAYNRTVPDLVVAVSETTVVARLTHDSKVVKRLWDQRRLWVIVFSTKSLIDTVRTFEPDSPAAKLAAKNLSVDAVESAYARRSGAGHKVPVVLDIERSGTCSVSHETLTYQRHSSERSIGDVFAAVLQNVFGAAVKPGAESPRDTLLTREVQLSKARPVSTLARPRSRSQLIRPTGWY